MRQGLFVLLAGTVVAIGCGGTQVASVPPIEPVVKPQAQTDLLEEMMDIEEPEAAAEGDAEQAGTEDETATEGEATEEEAAEGEPAAEKQPEKPAAKKPDAKKPAAAPKK